MQKCPVCHKSDDVEIVDRYERGHIHYMCTRPGCATSWRERNRKVVKSSIVTSRKRRVRK
jgi:hypothetical protein